MCTICGAGNKADFFKFDWKLQKWNLVVVLGAVIGGFIGSYFLSTHTSSSTKYRDHFRTKISRF